MTNEPSIYYQILSRPKGTKLVPRSLYASLSGGEEEARKALAEAKQKHGKIFDLTLTRITTITTVEELAP